MSEEPFSDEDANLLFREMFGSNPEPWCKTIAPHANSLDECAFPWGKQRGEWCEENAWWWRYRGTAIDEAAEIAKREEEAKLEEEKTGVWGTDFGEIYRRVWKEVFASSAFIHELAIRAKTGAEGYPYSGPWPLLSTRDKLVIADRWRTLASASETAVVAYEVREGEDVVEQVAKMFVGTGRWTPVHAFRYNLDRADSDILKDAANYLKEWLGDVRREVDVPNPGKKRLNVQGVTPFDVKEASWLMLEDLDANISPSGKYKSMKSNYLKLLREGLALGPFTSA